MKPEISEIQLDNIIGGEEIDETAVLLDVDDDDVDFDEVEDDDGAGEVDIKQEPSENFVDEAYEEIQMEEEQFQESPEDANLTDKVYFFKVSFSLDGLEISIIDIENSASILSMF